MVKQIDGGWLGVDVESFGGKSASLLLNQELRPGCRMHAQTCPPLL